MNWNSSIDSISGKTVVEKMLLMKLPFDAAISAGACRSAAIFAAVTPPV